MRRARIASVLVAALGVAVAAFPAATPARAAVAIQPGARVSSPVGGCTLNFVYDGVGSRAGKVYLGVAAHCANTGHSMRDAGGIWGTVVARGWDQAGGVTNDWALIEVKPAHVARVSPAVKGHPAYPTGVSEVADTLSGDLIQLSGYGTGFSATTETQERRVGNLTFDEFGVWTGTAPALWGDSGGPVVHIRSGKALGIVTNLCVITPCTSKGPLVADIITKAGAAGFPVQLRTV